MAPFSGVRLERALIFTDRAEPGGYALYAYLLMERSADPARRRAVLNVYLCDIRAAGTGQATPRKGALIVPVATKAADYPVPGPGDLDRLMRDYDSYAAHDRLLDLVQQGRMKPSDLRPDGIYFGAFDQPIGAMPTRSAIYEISGLPQPADVANWLLAEREDIELGRQVATPGVQRVPSTAREILDGVGNAMADMLHIALPSAQAATVCE
ncbi:MAG TPA: hypothetical protein VNT30_08465 [Stellaceae bacterium]|nr:hypothetical protein [Stellaceae bacterium]